MEPFYLTGSDASADANITESSTSSVEIASTGDLLQCAIWCVRDGNCVGCSRNLAPTHSTHAHAQIYLHRPCYRVFPLCTQENEDTDFWYLERANSCQHGGHWEPSVQRCSCANTVSYVGEFCQRPAERCSEFEASGYPAGFLQATFTFPGYGDGFPALCWLTGDWDDRATLIFFRSTSSLSTEFANRSWAEYEAGFWDYSIYTGWFGLSNMLKVLRYTKPSEVELRVGVGDSYFVQAYRGFNLTDARDHYALSFSDVSVTRGYGTSPETILSPCFTASANGTRFSTSDSDNDGREDLNCAARAGGGWWYRQCNESCNVFLPFYDSEHPEPESYTMIRIGGIKLRDWADSLTAIRLIIRQEL